MANHSDQLINSADAPADPQRDAHRAIANEWLRRAIDGIKEMHLNDDVRREVAGRLF
jgi:hypothetical protein